MLAYPVVTIAGRGDPRDGRSDFGGCHFGGATGWGSTPMIRSPLRAPKLSFEVVPGTITLDPLIPGEIVPGTIVEPEVPGITVPGGNIVEPEVPGTIVVPGRTVSPTIPSLTTGPG